MSMQTKKVSRRIAYALLGLLAVGFCLWVPSMFGQGRGAFGQRNSSAPARDWSQDMQMKITEPFTLASVGDVMIIRPASQIDDPRFQSAIKIIQGADVGFGNFESLIRDELHYEGPLSAGMNGTKEVAWDLKAMGFKMMNRAGNHLLESNQEGLFETIRLLQEAGLVYAGAGRNLDDARAPRFLETPKGRVGMVGMFAPNDDRPGDAGQGQREAATYRIGNTGGRPGLNALFLTRAFIVSQDQFDALKKVRDAIYEHRTDYSNPVDLPANEPSDQINLFGKTYKVGDKPGFLTYTMNPSDLSENLRSIKDGKEYSDFMIATIHAHEGDTALQPYLVEDETPDFLVKLAHDSIDNGADAFVGHGPHVLRGIEIYKGKPIFYDLGEFFREWDWGCDCDQIPGAAVTAAERNLKTGLSALPVNYESAIALSKYDKGKLQEVLIYPIDTGFAGPISQRGIPRTASPEAAQRILQRLQKLSEPFGTKISIEGNVGVIRVAQ